MLQRSARREQQTRDVRTGRTSTGRAFPVPGPTSAAWREEALTRAAEFDDLADWLQRQHHLDPVHPLRVAVRDHVTKASTEASRWSPLGTLTGASVERTRSRLDAAETMLLQFAPLGYVASQLPSLVWHVSQHLGAHDLRRRAAEDILARVRPVMSPSSNGRRPADGVLRHLPAAPLTEQDRSTVVAAVRAASSAARREEMRLRSFRNVLLVTGVALVLVAAAILLLSLRSPGMLPLCFTPGGPDGTGGGGRVVCPIQDLSVEEPTSAHDAVAGAASEGDVPLVMLLGTVAAGIAAAATLRRIKGTSTPYSLPVALALVKLPTGALTAVLGLTLMRGGFVPGLSDLDSSAQILAWGVVFGYSQQLFTRLVDDRAQDVLDSIKRPPAAATGQATTAPG